MTNRSDGHDDELVRALDELFADDVFLTELSRGVDVSDGEDPLADLFLALRDEVESDMPTTPALADLGIDDSDEYFDDDYDDQLTATDVFVAIDEDDFDDDDDLDDSEFDDDESDDDLVDSEEDADDDQPEDDDDADNVIDLNSRRRWGLGRIASGLIGAAAATLVLAGAGGAVMSAKEGSPFYGLHQKLFGERADKAAVIELASKLEEVTNRTNKGDVKGAQQSLQEAQKIVDKLHNGQDKVEAQQKVDNTKTTVTTVTVTPPAPSPAPAQTTTVTVTVEAVPPAVAPVQTQQQQPQNAGTPTQAAPVRPSDGAQAPGAEPSQGQAPADPPLQLPDEYRR